MAKRAGIKGNEDLEPEDDGPAKQEEKAEDKPASVEPVQNTAQEPYPTGNPPDPEDEFAKIHGFRRDGK